MDALIYMGVNALTGFNLIATQEQVKQQIVRAANVSMPSRASTSLLRERSYYVKEYSEKCVNALTGFNLIATHQRQRYQLA